MSGNDAASALANAAGGRRQTVARDEHDRQERWVRSTRPCATRAGSTPPASTPRHTTSRCSPARVWPAQDFRDYATTIRARFPGKMPKHGKARKTFAIYTQDRLLLNYRGAIGSRRAGRPRPAAPSSAPPPATGTRSSRRSCTRVQLLERVTSTAGVGFRQSREGPPGRHPQPGEAEDPGIARASGRRGPEGKRGVGAHRVAAACRGGPACRCALLLDDRRAAHARAAAAASDPAGDIGDRAYRAAYSIPPPAPSASGRARPGAVAAQAATNIMS